MTDDVIERCEGVVGASACVEESVGGRDPSNHVTRRDGAGRGMQGGGETDPRGEGAQGEGVQECGPDQEGEREQGRERGQLASCRGEEGDVVL